jgi:hypothetical protein
MSSVQKRIDSIKADLLALGPMLPGSISEQWNVCGKAGCRCKNPDDPQKHGPYYQLSFTIGGKSSTMFVKKEDLGEVRERIEKHKRFRDLIGQGVRRSGSRARLRQEVDGK